MPSPDPHRILAAWTEARPQRPIDRALTLLAAVEPGGERDAYDALSIAERDRRLLHAFAAQFGSQLRGVAHCGTCGEPIEIACPAADLATLPGEALGSAHVAELQIEFRAPTSRDIDAVVASPMRSRRLVEQCIVRCARDGAAVDPAELPDTAIDGVAAAILALDPLLEVEFAATCPACGADQQFSFDPAGFLWTHLEAEARRLLTHVHQLATAYGWGEAEILALPETRRLAYLELADR